jgi:hypothetical protein
MMNRRFFIKAGLTLAAAPMIVRADSIMKICVPPRALKAEFITELTQDLKAVHGLDSNILLDLTEKLASQLTANFIIYGEEKNWPSECRQLQHIDIPRFGDLR